MAQSNPDVNRWQIIDRSVPSASICVEHSKGGAAIIAVLTSLESGKLLITCSECPYAEILEELKLNEATGQWG